MDRKTAALLHDAMVASDEIAVYTAGLSREQFDEQRGVQLIVERLIITVGEALSQANRSFEGLAKVLPELDGIVGMRNIIVHGYRDIDADIVWNVVVTKAPELANLIRDLLAEQAPPLSERRVQGG
jgi:uncharacterized protein with HEPN domain